MNWHWLTIFVTWVYHHESMYHIHSWSWYYVDLWPQGQIYRVYDIWICVRASAFSSFDIAILCLARECITIVRYVTYIHELCITLTFDLNIKIFIYLSLSRCLAPWHRHTKFWYIDVSPWDNMCTFLTLVWPWPLTYMWGVGDILSEFYSQFLSFYFPIASI